MQQLLEDAAQRASRYLESLADRAVWPDPVAVQQLAELDIALPVEGGRDAEVLKLLDERVGPATMAMAGPRFFGFVIGGALPVTVAGNWLATAWDQNTGLYRSTPGTSHLEQVALAWLKQLFGFPANLFFDLFPLHAEGRVRQHVVELAGRLPVLRERVSAHDVLGALPLDHHVALADGVRLRVQLRPKTFSSALGLSSRRYSSATDSIPPVPAAGS